MDNGCITHGMTNTRIYRLYRGVVERCKNKNNNLCKNYGYRGIKCLWKTFEEFYKDMGENYELHCNKYGINDTTIDRIDNNGNYCKENCRWATYKEQNNNQSTNHEIELNGTIYPSVSIFCDKLGLNYSTFYNFILQGYSVQDAIDKTRYLEVHPRYARKKKILG